MTKRVKKVVFREYEMSPTLKHLEYYIHLPDEPIVYHSFCFTKSYKKTM